MTTTPDTPMPHRVTWDGDYATFHCDGGQDAPCRNYPACECEVWDEGCTHEDMPQDECWILPWLNNSDADEIWHDGGELLTSMPRVNAPIGTEWDGDAVTWCYAGLAAAGGASA